MYIELSKTFNTNNEIIIYCIIEYLTLKFKMKQTNINYFTFNLLIFLFHRYQSKIIIVFMVIILYL